MLNTSHYKIIAIGKARKKWIKEALSIYLKRLPGLTIKELRDSTPQKETHAILSILNKKEFMVALTENGEKLTSVDFAKRLNNLGSNQVTFVIGGADGLTPEIKKLAQWELSLSSMTFPHEIARLLLAEQLYRACSILQGSPYHRGEAN